MAIVTVDVLLSSMPSLAFHVKVSVPFQSVFGVYVAIWLPDPERTTDPFEGFETIDRVNMLED